MYCDSALYEITYLLSYRGLTIICLSGCLFCHTFVLLTKRYDITWDKTVLLLTFRECEKVKKIVVILSACHNGALPLGTSKNYSYITYDKL